MKKSIYLLLTLGVLSGLFSACSDFFLPENQNGIPEGVIFYTTAQGLSFYFVDEDGNDMVTLEDRTTWPLAFPQKMEASTREAAVARADAEARSDGRVFYIYNDNCNAICQDFENRRYGFSTYLWGRTIEPEYTTYLYIGNSLDSLKVGFNYHQAQESQTSGASWLVEINSVKYNGVEVFTGNKNGKVFVQKPSQGETVVKVGIADWVQ